MITYTILDKPVNMNQLAIALTLKGEVFRPLTQALAEKVSESFKDYWLEEEVPEVCPICKDGIPTHYPPACEDCVQEGKVQCQCCNVNVELVYDIESLGFHCFLTDSGQIKIAKKR